MGSFVNNVYINLDKMQVNLTGFSPPGKDTIKVDTPGPVCVCVCVYVCVCVCVCVYLIQCTVNLCNEKNILHQENMTVKMYTPLNPNFIE